MTRGTRQRLASLEQDARQPRLAMKVDVQADTKTRERTEGAATVVQAVHRDNCSANRVDPDPMCSTSFGGDSTGPPALPCSRDDVLVGNGAAASKLCLSPLEMRKTNSRRWLTPRRHGHYNDKDHFPAAASLVLLDQRDKVEDFNSICLVLQQLWVDKQPASLLLAEGY